MAALGAIFSNNSLEICNWALGYAVWAKFLGEHCLRKIAISQKFYIVFRHLEALQFERMVRKNWPPARLKMRTLVPHRLVVRSFELMVRSFVPRVRGFGLKVCSLGPRVRIFVRARGLGPRVRSFGSKFLETHC